MGWTYVYKPDMEEQRAFVKNIFKGMPYTVDDIAMRGSEAYVRLTHMATNESSACVVLLRANDHSRHNMGYKLIGETEGPYYWGCPAHIIHALTPSDNPIVNAWRQACLTNTRPDYDLARQKERHYAA